MLRQQCPLGKRKASVSADGYYLFYHIIVLFAPMKTQFEHKNMKYFVFKVFNFIGATGEIKCVCENLMWHHKYRQTTADAALKKKILCDLRTCVLCTESMRPIIDRKMNSNYFNNQKSIIGYLWVCGLLVKQNKTFEDVSCISAKF